MPAGGEGGCRRPESRQPKARRHGAQRGLAVNPEASSRRNPCGNQPVDGNKKIVSGVERSRGKTWKSDAAQGAMRGLTETTHSSKSRPYFRRILEFRVNRNVRLNRKARANCQGPVRLFRGFKGCRDLHQPAPRGSTHRRSVTVEPVNCAAFHHLRPRMGAGRGPEPSCQCPSVCGSQNR